MKLTQHPWFGWALCLVLMVPIFTFSLRLPSNAEQGERVASVPILMAQESSIDIGVGDLCGDSSRTGLEGCDDGNTTNGDGCSSTCTVESGYSCNNATPNVCSTTCGDGIRAGAEGCDDGNTTNGDGCSATCTVQSGYSCNSATPNVCSTTCGDGITAGSEQCDDGNASNTDACLNSCLSARCGDEYVWEGHEVCDGGTCNSQCSEQQAGVGGGGGGGGGTDTSGNGGGTTSYYTPGSEDRRRNGPPPLCGNSRVDTGEQCDDGPANGYTQCNSQCQKKVCGNGIVEAPEQCEPPRTKTGLFIVYTCGPTCTPPSYDASTDSFIGGCVLQFQNACKEEQQQLPPAITPDATPPWRLIAPPEIILPPSAFFPRSYVPPSVDVVSDVQEVLQRCGNMQIDPGEQCDDGNESGGDGCSTLCLLEQLDFQECPGGQGGLCDVSAPYIGDDCGFACDQPVCGNSILERGEECDDGPRNTDQMPNACSPTCKMPSCGDNMIDTAFGEECDAGQQNSDTRTDGCRTDCRVAWCGDGIVDAGEQCDSADPDMCNPNCTLAFCGTQEGQASTECQPTHGAAPETCDTDCQADSRRVAILWILAILLPASATVLYRSFQLEKENLKP